MKKVILLLLSLSLLLCGCREEPPKETIKPGEPVLAAFSATDLNGNSVHQQIFSGHKLTMVNVWATFCGPCIQEMPDLGELSSAYGEDFQIIGIVIDATDRNLQVLPEQKAKAKQIIAETGADYLHLLPSPTLNNAILSTVTSVPTTIFVDENGNQVGDIYIGSKAKAQWKTIIDSLLNSI